MSDSQTRWNDKYRDSGTRPLRAPDSLFIELLNHIELEEAARVVDLACGRGRHIEPLLQRGWRVEGWDVSDVAIAQLGYRFGDAGAADRFATRQVDLERRPLPPAPSFDLAVIVDFLDEPLFADVHTLLRPAGYLLFVTYTVDFLGEHPRREFRLQRGQLAQGLPRFKTIRSVEREGRAGFLGQLAREPSNDE